MRARSTIDRNYSSDYDSGPCPTWMKTLEDKYKRLHMKIVFNTNSARVRPRPSGASSTVSGGGRYSRISQRLRATPLRGPRTISPCTEHNFVKSENGTSDDVIINNAFEKDVTPSDDVSEQNIENDQNNVDDLSELKSEVSSEKDPSSNMDYCRNSTNSSSVRDRIQRRSHNKKIVSKSGENGDTRYHRPDTYKTVKSCPSTFNEADLTADVRHDKKTDVENSPKKRRSKLFQRMSKEAQTAINETLCEKKKESGGIGREKSFMLNNYSNLMRTSRTDMCAPNVCQNGKESIPDRPRSCEPRPINTSSSSSSSTMNKTRLPEISSSRTDSSPKDIRQRNVILPGVGRYQIPVGLPIREQTFQVTGAEYDIRYREVINCERADSVTPPSDILEQAIMKCQEWLTKYAVYAKR
ncbi:uncharacterized protein LOC126831488 [Patella vulgata]|uniref:uncharacterized protein LOC126831488 n=1 Tax=Patella vulgata TaxID=6465 RepID=UPI00217FBC33|nr:uncharacterized protein LOC126831488 [Patella vulgata]